jgi:hypothetical protein
MVTESAKGNRHHRTHVALQDLTLTASLTASCRSALQSAKGHHGEHGESCKVVKSGAVVVPTISLCKSGA